MALNSEKNGCALYGDGDDFSNIKKKVAVVLPAAGTGQRFGTDPPKQFAVLLDRPVWSYAVENFLAFKSTHFEIMAIVFVIPPVYREQVTDDLLKYFKSASGRIRVVHGEATRHRSISVAAKFLENSIDLHVDLIVINDAVRIFFDPQKLESQMQIASECGACGIFVPAVSTSIRVQQENSLLKEQKPRWVVMTQALSRSPDVVCSEMPQVFRADAFFNMYNKVGTKARKFHEIC